MGWTRTKATEDRSRGKFREKWGQLTDDDTKAVAGRRPVLAGKLQERHGRAKEQAHRKLDEFAKELEH